MHFKKYIPISSRVDSLSNDMTYNIHINNSELNKVTHTKFLGVIIDENLTWEQHIKALSKKLARCTGSLNRIIQFLPKNMHKELYYTLLESYLAYGVTVWGKASKSKLRYNKTNGAFSICAPVVWNALPYSIRSSNCINKFKVALKTHYFRIAFKNSDETFDDIEQLF